MPEGPPAVLSILDRLRASYRPDRSGDLLVVLKPHISPSANPDSTGTHGSPWDYDRKVPILFWWQGIAPEDRRGDAMAVDIMPTLARLMRLPVPTEGFHGRGPDLLPGQRANRARGCVRASA